MFGVEQLFTHLAANKQPLIYFFADAAQPLSLTLHAAWSPPHVGRDIFKAHVSPMNFQKNNNTQEKTDLTTK